MLIRNSDDMIRLLKFQEKAKLTERCLKNLLAVIHRDGGHYTEKHGIEKSCNDAMQIVAEAIVK